MNNFEIIIIVLVIVASMGASFIMAAQEDQALITKIKCEQALERTKLLPSNNARLYQPTIKTNWKVC